MHSQLMFSFRQPPEPHATVLSQSSLLNLLALLGNLPHITRCFRNRPGLAAFALTPPVFESLPAFMSSQKAL